MKYIDAHCHVLQESATRGVGGFIVNATSPDDWSAVIKMVERENAFGAIGVHPWHVSNLNDGWDARLIELLGNNPKIMVGEIGLDKNRPNMKFQESVFRRQLQIAHDMKRVAHIHCVGAWGLCMEVLCGGNLPPAMLFHCFSGSVEIMRELTKMNSYFSFGPGIMDSTRRVMRDVVANVPENHTPEARL